MNNQLILLENDGNDLGPSTDPFLNIPPPPWLTDLFLWLLGLQGITVGSVAVWAVMLTVVICCFGISHNQKLLDVTLQKTQKAESVSPMCHDSSMTV